MQTSYQPGTTTCTILDHFTHPPETDNTPAPMAMEDSSYFKDTHLDYLLEQSGIELDSVLDGSSVFEGLGSSMFNVDFYDPFSIPGLFPFTGEEKAAEMGPTGTANPWAIRGESAEHDDCQTAENKYPSSAGLYHQFPSSHHHQQHIESFAPSGCVAGSIMTQGGQYSMATSPGGYAKGADYQLLENCRADPKGRKVYQTLQDPVSPPIHRYAEQKSVGGYPGPSPPQTGDVGVVKGSHQLHYLAQQQGYHPTSGYDMAPLSPPGMHFRFPSQGQLQRQSFLSASSGMSPTISSQTVPEIW